ncbi:hypothetical protein DM860_000907 [Cuscuta australis]|uniref:Uncharacterized protein n=1 Tax=Cuscuta australis TaxID=267555 RepID=A0A328DSA5_9ASTE|nr:hypothetical protein DM860_000907 [Cuscuta australis]
MKEQSNYVPPPYIPLRQTDREPENSQSMEQVSPHPGNGGGGGGQQWSSGICACFDDPQSCLVGLLCPCYLFGKNAEFLGSGTLAGSCLIHFILWALVNTFCCVLTEGMPLGLPGCLVACYASGYRRTLRSKYNLQEAPCGDFTTHFFCHYCAMCQEYREIRERRGELESPNPNRIEVIAPQVQTMELTPESN